MLDPAHFHRAVPWVLRLLWIGVLLTGGRALDGALDHTGGTAADVARWVALGVWIVGVAAMAVPAVTSLTATRLVVPLATPAAAVAWIAGADAVDGAASVGLAILAAIVAGSSALGRSFVQASAYGAEDRHLLRPPLPYLVAGVLAWSIWAACAIAGVIAAARGAVVAAAVLAVLTVVIAALGFPRWHRLARRWLVIVPVGLVVHDHLVLAETLMLRRQEIARIGLAPADTEAADFTGAAPGHAIEIRTTEPVTALVNLVPGAPRGGAIHLTGCLVAPTRPGQVLTAAAARRFAVGAVG